MRDAITAAVEAGDLDEARRLFAEAEGKNALSGHDRHDMARMIARAAERAEVAAKKPRKAKSKDEPVPEPAPKPSNSGSSELPKKARNPRKKASQGDK